MSDLWETLKKSKLGQSLLLGSVMGIILCSLQWAGVFNPLDSSRLNDYYTTRDETEIQRDDSILVWAIGDTDLKGMHNRWPWPWRYFSEIFRFINLYEAQFTVLEADIFSDPDSITMDSELAMRKYDQIETLIMQTTSVKMLKESLNSILPDPGQGFLTQLDNYPAEVFNCTFIIPDDQSPDNIKREYSNRLKYRTASQKERLKTMKERFGKPWKERKDILAAVEVKPPVESLLPKLSHVGFTRIIPDPDPDGTIRRTPTMAWFEEYLFFSQPVLAAAQELHCPVDKIEVKPGEHLLIREHRDGGLVDGGRSYRIPIDNRGLMYINWTRSGLQFRPATLTLIRHFILPNMLKRATQGRLINDEGALDAFYQHFLEQIASSGTGNKEDYFLTTLEILMAWYADSLIEYEFSLIEALTEKTDFFIARFQSNPFLAEHYGLDYFYTPLTWMNNYDLPQIYQSIRLNRAALTLANSGKEPVYDDLVKELDIKPNIISYHYLTVQLGDPDLVFRLFEDGFIAPHPDTPDNLGENTDRAFIINHSHLNKEDYLQLFVDKKYAETVKAAESMNLAAPIQHVLESNRRFKEGFKHTLFFKNKPKVSEVLPLYFRLSAPWIYYNERSQFAPPDIQGKKIFIGVTATGLNSFNPSPYSTREMMAGVPPTAYNTISTKSFLSKPEQLNAVIIFLFSLFAVVITLTLPYLLSLFLIILASVTYAYLCFTLFVKPGVILDINAPLLGLMLGHIAGILYVYWDARKERMKIRSMFSSMVSPDVLRILEENPERLRLEGQLMDASMFSSDVSGFTSISEGVTAQELANILNLYLTPMSNLVMTYGGYVEKYEGDAIKADFGMPFPDPDHSWKACFSALLQQEELSVVQRMLQVKYGVMISARMGVNTGTVSAGNMGSERRMQYCALGTAVAMAEELEPSNKMYDTWVSIGPETHRLAGDRIYTRLLDKVDYGHEAINMFELFGWKRDDFVNFWKGKPIPPLVIEGWERIIPEKILAYLDYYEARNLPNNKFKDLFVGVLKELKEPCIDAIILNDRMDIYELDQEYDRCVSILSTHDKDNWEDSLAAIDKREIETVRKRHEDAKDDWMKKITWYQLGLKRYRNLVASLFGKIPQNEYDEFERIVDTLDKRVICILKRVAFPQEDDAVALKLADNLKSSIVDPKSLFDEQGLIASRTEHENKLATIKEKMNRFIEQAKELAEDYHEFIADHCLPNPDKIRCCEIFNEGRKLYLQQKWNEAEAKFKEGLGILPDDGPCQTFIKRCQNFRNNPPPQGWDGTWEADF